MSIRGAGAGGDGIQLSVLICLVASCTESLRRALRCPYACGGSLSRPRPRVRALAEPLLERRGGVGAGVPILDYDGRVQ